MAQKKKESARVVSQKQLSPGIFDLILKTDLARDAACGQFVAVYPKDKSTLLPRPISICEADKETGTLRLVYRVAGKGTAEFSGLKAGDSVDILGVLGNGFPTGKAQPGMTAVLLGGGIGVPPILQLSKELDCVKKVVVGYRDAQCFLKEDFESAVCGGALATDGDVQETAAAADSRGVQKCGSSDAHNGVYIATEDGSVGTKGNVMDAVAANGIKADIIYACGPMPMLRAIKKYAEEHGIPAYISLEERMACGVGACLGCVCKTAQVDHHSHVNNARICTDGPVFEAREVDI